MKILIYNLRGTLWHRTALQAGRSIVRFAMVSLEFFIDIILPARICSWLLLCFYQKWVPGIFLADKGGRGVGLTTLWPSFTDCLEIWRQNLLERPKPVQGRTGIALPLPLVLTLHYRPHVKFSENTILLTA